MPTKHLGKVGLRTTRLRKNSDPGGGVKCDQQLRTVGCLRNVGTIAERRGSSVASAFFSPSSAIHRRYTVCRFLRTPYCYLQGITVRPVPCNYNVIQHISALSRR